MTKEKSSTKKTNQKRKASKKEQEKQDDQEDYFKPIVYTTFVGPYEINFTMMELFLLFTTILSWLFYLYHYNPWV